MTGDLNHKAPQGTSDSSHGSSVRNRHQDDIHLAEEHIEHHLSHHAHDFKHVFKELDHLRNLHPRGIQQDLVQINADLHKKGFLPHLHIIQDDRVGKNRHVNNGFSVVADDKQNPKGNHTEVSTSHDQPHEPEAVKKEYHSMHYKHGHYNGFKQSAEVNGGGNGGFDKHAVGGHVPEGARKELIDKALKLAGIPMTPENEAAVNKIVTRESGWNPNTTNNWDSNAKAGHPSTGLMQTIPGTFQKYALPGMNDNIHDPLSNLVAGIRYAETRYGGHGMSGVAKVASRPGGY